MSRTWKETKQCIEQDIAPFSKNTRTAYRIWNFLTKDINYYRIRYCVHLRKLEYFNDKFFFFPLKYHHRYQLNRIGRMFSWEVHLYTCDAGLHIWHANVIVNDDAHIGKNAVFHGNNCIGRKDDTPQGDVSPQIGDDLNLGVGSNIIGGVLLGDNVYVGANSLVIDSYPEGHCLLVGSPARCIKKQMQPEES